MHHMKIQTLWGFTTSMFLFFFHSLSASLPTFVLPVILCWKKYCFQYRAFTVVSTLLTLCLCCTMSTVRCGEWLCCCAYCGSDAKTDCECQQNIIHFRRPSQRCGCLWRPVGSVLLASSAPPALSSSVWSLRSLCVEWSHWNRP